MHVICCELEVQTTESLYLLFSHSLDHKNHACSCVYKYGPQFFTGCGILIRAAEFALLHRILQFSRKFMEF